MNLSTCYKLLIATTLFFSLHQPVNAQQADSAGLITVTADIVGKGVIPHYENQGPFFFIIINVTNVQDTTIRFYIMTCSWPSNNCVLNTDSVILWYPGCDSNIPEEIVLQPQQSIRFYGALRYSLKKPPVNQEIRLGFIYYRTWKDIWNETRHDKFPRYWSNMVRLEYPMFGYRKD